MSDWDYVSLVIPPRNLVLSPFKNFKGTTWKGAGTTGRISEVANIVEAESEGNIRSLERFFAEAVKCNPNVLECLWVDQRHVIHQTPEGQALRAARNMFLSQKAVKSFGGYAYEQMHRIKRHKAWQDGGRPQVPSRADFGLPPRPKVSVDQQGAADAFVRRYMHEVAPWLEQRRNEEKLEFWKAMQNIMSIVLQDKSIAWDPSSDNWHAIEQEAAYSAAAALGLGTNFVEYVKREKAYGQLQKQARDYDAWARSRNPARKELESKYGYDTKHAMHAVRLIRMGQELLRGQEIQVLRPDAQELQLIRNGGWSYDQLIEWTEREVNIMYDLVRKNKSPLPAEPDYNKIEVLYVQLLEDFWRRNNELQSNHHNRALAPAPKRRQAVSRRRGRTPASVRRRRLR